jgi:hypothetical protein
MLAFSAIFSVWINHGANAGSLPEWVGYVLLAVAVVGFLIFELFKSRMKFLQRFLNTVSPMTKEEQAATACNGIHVALTMILTIALIGFGFIDSLLYILVPFMLLGWIPLRIWLYPFLLKRMK